MIKLIVPRQNQPPPHEGDGDLYVYPRPSHHKKNDGVRFVSGSSIISIIV